MDARYGPPPFFRRGPRPECTDHAAGASLSCRRGRRAHNCPPTQHQSGEAGAGRPSDATALQLPAALWNVSERDGSAARACSHRPLPPLYHPPASGGSEQCRFLGGVSGNAAPRRHPRLPTACLAVKRQSESLVQPDLLCKRTNVIAGKDPKRTGTIGRLHCWRAGWLPAAWRACVPTCCCQVGLL